jgi:hypothetical protein
MYDGSLQHVSLTRKFTGKERDSESGLDNFGARYYSNRRVAQALVLGFSGAPSSGFEGGDFPALLS